MVGDIIAPILTCTTIVLK